MSKISMTQFVDFVLKNGSPRVTHARNVISQCNDEYDPRKDYWKCFRDHIIQFHKTGQDPKGITTLPANIDPKKIGRYSQHLHGYAKWLKKPQVQWFTPPQGLWAYKGLAIRVNPEIGLKIDGVDHVIKLYLKGEKLNPHRIGCISDLLYFGLKPILPSSTKIIFLDVAKGKGYDVSNIQQPSEVLLCAEATCLLELWNQLDPSPVRMNYPNQPPPQNYNQPYS